MTNNDAALGTALRHAAFSEFVSALSQARSLDALCGSLSSKLKYVVDAYLWQISFFSPSEVIVYTSSARRVRLARAQGGPLVEHLQAVVEGNIPIRTVGDGVRAQPAFAGSIFHDPHLGELLAMPVILGGSRLCVLLGGRQASSFTSQDLQFARLLGEHVATRVEHFLTVETLERHSQLLEQNVATIRAQREELMQLSAPSIEVWEGIVVLPLIGSIVRERIDEITNRVFASLQRSDAHELLIDLTGALSLDVDALLRFVRGLGLLGMHCALVGIKPELAIQLVEHRGAAVDVTTYASLREGLQAALRRRNELGARPRG